MAQLPRGNPLVEEAKQIIASARGPEASFGAWEQAYNKLRRDFMSPVPGSRVSYNLAPNAPNRVVQMPDGKIIKVPQGSQVPRGGTVLNKTDDDIRAMLPERPPMPAALREQRYGPEVPIAGPAAVVAGAVGVPTAIAYQRDSLPRPAAAGRPVEAEGVTDPASGAVIMPTEFRLSPQGRALQIARSQQDYSGMGGGYGTPREMMTPSGAGIGRTYGSFDETNIGAPRFSQDITAGDTFRNLPGYEGEGGGEAAQQRPVSLNSLPTFAQGATSGGYDPAVVNLARSVVAPRSSAPTGNVPTPTPRPKDEGFFSSLTSKPLSRDELLTAYNKSMQDEGGGNAALFALLERANKEEGMRRGGVAQQPQAAKGGGKDAALHKALEIIHHMLTTRH